MYDIITVGSATIDVFAKTDCEIVTLKSKNEKEEYLAYPCGSKILIEKLGFHVGGGGTNTAVAMSRLGLKTAYLGNIGKDENGRKILDLLKKEKIEFIGTISENMTNYSIVLDSEKDDRTILAYKDASEKLKIKNVDNEKLVSQWFYFCSMPIKTLEKLVPIANKRHIKIAFNPSNYLAEKGSEYLKTILKNTKLLILNEEEAELLVGKEPIHFLLHSLSNLGPKIVVVTMGARGASVIHNNIIYYSEPIKVKIKETTGAGDAFGASFLSGLLLKNSVLFALKLAIANAASVISHDGAKNKLLSLKETEILIKKHKIKVKTVNLKK